MIVVGETIAIGIFLTPAGMAKSLGSPFWLLMIWLVVGAMALCGALCYGELAARYPEAGGGYVYLREAYGRPLAFMYGWMAFLVMDPGITAALAVGIASYAGYLISLPPIGLKLIAMGTLVAIAIVNILGVRAGAWLLRWLTFIKLGSLFFIIVWGFGSGLGDWSNFTPFVGQRAGSAPLVIALAGAFVAAFFSFGGWWDLNKLAEEVRDPERTMPRALVYGVLIVTLVYLLTSAVFVYLVPVETVTTGETFAAQAGERMFGAFGGQLFSGIVIVAVLGGIAGITMSAPRVYYAMARDRLFFQAAALIHPKTGTPAAAIAFQAGLACLLVLFGTFEEIIAYFIFVVVLFIALTVAAIFRLRTSSDKGASYLTPGYPFTPILFLILVALLLIMLAVNNPRQAALGVGVVALGLPAYYLIFRRRDFTA